MSPDKRLREKDGDRENLVKKIGEKRSQKGPQGGKIRHPLTKSLNGNEKNCGFKGGGREILRSAANYGVKNSERLVRVIGEEE